MELFLELTYKPGIRSRFCICNPCKINRLITMIIKIFNFDQLIKISNDYYTFVFTILNIYILKKNLKIHESN